MKIALVRTASNILTYGSYNIQEIGLAKALLKYNISTDIYARFSNLEKCTIIAEKDQCKVTIHPLKGKRIYREIMYYPSLISDLCNRNYDIVQCLDDSQMMLPFIFKKLKKKGVKTILWQGMYRDFSSKPALLLQKVYDILFKSSINKYTDLKIAKTDYAKKYLEDKGYSNIITIPVGLISVDDVNNSKYEKELITFKEKHEKILLYIGAIENRRNPFFLLNLLKKLPNNIGMIMIGKGPLLMETKNKILESGLSDRILQYERIPNNELKCFYDKSDLFLLPTNYEIYGMVIMEALQYGCPCLSTPEAGPETILKDIRLGSCVKLNESEWLDQINFYLSNYNSSEDKKYRYLEIEENYRWEKIAVKYQEVLYNLIK